MADATPAIRKVFETRLSSTTGVPDIAWENVSFDPTTTQPYIHARLVPTIRRDASRGQNAKKYYQGYYLMDVYAPDGKGPSEADTLVSLLIDRFEGNTDITDGTTIIPIRYAERDLGIPDGAFYKVSVRIGYYYYD